MTPPKGKAESDTPSAEELEQAVRLADPFGGDLKTFTADMENRQVNHRAFLDFVDKNLKKGIDFGRIHRSPKEPNKCYAGNDCEIKSHFTKPSLFKPGAEKVLGWLGATPIWPNLAAYEELALNGDPIQTIILRCEAWLPDGTCIGYGLGGRAVEYREGGTYKDLNRDLKMAKKSAMIDCAITSGRMSEHFTQDVEDMFGEGSGDKGNGKPPKKYSKGEPRWLDLKPDDVVPSGKHQGKKVRELAEGYLKRLGEKNPTFREFCKRELDRRRKGTSGAQTTAGWKIPEVGVFTDEMSSETVQALITDRYKATKPANLTKAQNEDFLAYLQAERTARELYNQIPDIARSTVSARFGQHAEYRKLEPGQMKELGVVLEFRLAIESARKQIPDNFDMLLADWENATGETLETATGKQYGQLIITLRTNGFEG